MCFEPRLIFWVDGGTESLGITAGETKNPSKNIPRVVKAVFWRFVSQISCLMLLELTEKIVVFYSSTCSLSGSSV
jgi:AAT family amino acid transporter